MILVNPTYGGIGTGWSCNIPGYHPKQLVEWISCWLSVKEGQPIEFPTLTPFYRGFKGTITVENGRITTFGVLSKLKNGHYRITEIPIGRKMLSIEKYKEKLLDLKEEGVIKDIISDDHTDEVVDFTVSSDKELTHKLLHLVDTISMSNMVCFNSKGKLQKYANVDEMLEEYCDIRYKLYITRKEGEIRKREHHISVLESKITFISGVVSKKIDLQKMTDDDLHTYLTKHKVLKIEDGYEYLLSMQVRNMTKTKIGNLEEQLEKEKVELEAYRKITPADMWRNECTDVLKLCVF
jgi:DNA topoisomerase-2